MRGDMLGADALGELARRALGHAARVDEDQRGAMRRDELGEAVIDLLPDLARHHGFERRGRHFEGEVAVAAVAGVDDAAAGLGAFADEKPRDGLDRLLRRRETDAQQAVVAERGQALERQREMGAALVRRHRVYLIDDHRPRGREHGAAGLRTQHGCRAIPAW